MLLELLKVTLTLVAVLAVSLMLGLAIKRIIGHIEANPHGSRTLVHSVLYASVAGHLYLYFMEIPRLFVLYSLSIQIVLLWLYEEYPHMKVSDPRFIVGTLGTTLSHFALTNIVMGMDLSFVAIVVCYATIWVSPVMCFFSLSATDEILPLEATKRRSSRLLGSLVEWAQGMCTRARIKN